MQSKNVFYLKLKKEKNTCGKRYFLGTHYKFPLSSQIEVAVFLKANLGIQSPFFKFNFCYFYYSKVSRISFMRLVNCSGLAFCYLGGFMAPGLKINTESVYGFISRTG